MNRKKKNKTKRFGWPSAFKYYSTRDIIKDFRIPGLISLLIMLVIACRDCDLVVIIGRISEMGLSVVPAMVALILAAYTILISMYWAPICDKLKSDEETGLPLLKGLNASFAITIRYATIGIVFLFSVFCIGEIQVSAPENVLIACNLLIIWCVVFFVIFPIYMLIDIAINIYNIAVFSIDSKPVTEQKQNEEQPR